MALKTETLTIKVSPEEKAKIKALAAESDQTVSKFMYNLLIKNLKEAKDGSSKSKNCIG